MTAFGCIANTIKLRSGLYLDLADPQPDQFTFADIACALAKICRFGAQIPQWYSVAEHCYWCATFASLDGLPLDTQAAVLMHDAAEAFLGDVVKPLKVMLKDYARIESRMEEAIAEKFLIDFRREEPLIKKYDQAMLIAERNAIFGRDGHRWHGEEEVHQLGNFRPDFWDHDSAEKMFTMRARMVGIDTDGKDGERVGKGCDQETVGG